jgi:hypothetical protein
MLPSEPNLHPSRGHNTRNSPVDPSGGGGLAQAEAALALQAGCTHMVAMVMMARIGGGHGGDRRLPALASAAAKLMRAHCLQVETYRRLRGGGDQQGAA